MKWVAAQCPSCMITQDLPPSCLFLEIAGMTDDSLVGSSASWICRPCDRLVGMHVDLVVLLSLVSAGAHLLELHENLQSDEVIAQQLLGEERHQPSAE
jgi:hypothetical protein